MKIRRIWPNENSTKDQVTVQFFTEIDNSVSNPLMAIAQGINMTSKVTALLSFARAQAIKLFGTDTFDAPDLNNPETYMAVPQEMKDFNIQIVENTTKNPATPNQTAKVNPKTGEVLTVNNQPIYRHTSVVYGKPNNVFLQHDTTPAPAAAVVENVNAEDQKVI